MTNNILLTAMSFTHGLMVCKIPFAVTPFFDGYKWMFFDNEMDVVIHSGSYGHEEGLVESIGFPWDDDDVSSEYPEDMVRLIADFMEMINDDNSDFEGIEEWERD